MFLVLVFRLKDHFVDGDRKIIPKEGDLITEGSASYCAFRYSCNYKKTCTLGIKGSRWAVRDN